MELLVVVAIVATGALAVALSMRDSGRDALQTQAEALAAWLEAARAHSRAQGIAVVWRATPEGMAWDGLALEGSDALPTRWSAPDVRATSATPVVLGPEPLIGAHSIALWRLEQPEVRVFVATDGVRPFGLQSPGTP